MQDQTQPLQWITERKQQQRRQKMFDLKADAIGLTLAALGIALLVLSEALR